MADDLTEKAIKEATARGILPWSECDRDEKVRRMKENADMCDECVLEARDQIELLQEEILDHQADSERFREQARMIRNGETEDPASV